jgi:hypothetical protein
MVLLHLNQDKKQKALTREHAEPEELPYKHNSPAAPSQESQCDLG